MAYTGTETCAIEQARLDAITERLNGYIDRFVNLNIGLDALCIRLHGSGGERGEGGPAPVSSGVLGNLEGRIDALGDEVETFDVTFSRIRNIA